MKFVTTYFTKYHVLHAPHRWFLAFLLSPIHAFEVHYQKRYHLRFAHARTLFIFDITLLTSILILAGAISIWSWYDPTVADRITLRITPYEHTETQESGRIRSGEHIAYRIAYENHSSTDLINARLRFHIPFGFFEPTGLPAHLFSSTTQEFILGSIPRHAKGEVQLSGLMYGHLDKEEPLVAELTYIQKERNVHETKLATVLTTLRGSVVETTIEAPETILHDSTFPVTVRVRNTYHHALPPVVVSLPSLSGTQFTVVSSTQGAVLNTTWELPSLQANEEATLRLQAKAHFPQAVTSTTFVVTPQVRINAQLFPQTSYWHTAAILHPNLELNGVWKTPTQVRPGETATANISITNKNSFSLDSLALSLPLPSALVDTARFRAENSGVYANGVFSLNQNYRADFIRLNPGETRTITLTIPIHSVPEGGSDVMLRLEPRVSAKSAQFEGTFEATTNVPSLAIGTRLLFEAESRYYTDEGDQLGRGPLPPVVGKETKYALILRVRNTTSAIENLHVTAALPSGVTWTGKTSVSRGKEISYNPSNRTVSWSLPTMAPHDSVSLYLEVAVTPTEADRGQVPLLLTGLQAKAHDTFIQKDLFSEIKALDARLPHDERAGIKGVVVQ